MFLAVLITFIIPAAIPKIKKIKKNHGWDPSHLSSDQPIIEPTTIPDTSSVLNLKAKPIEFPRFSIFSDVFTSLSFSLNSSIFDIRSDASNFFLPSEFKSFLATIFT